MIDYDIIDIANLEAFLPLIKTEALALIEVRTSSGEDDRLLMLGVTDDDEPVGALVCDLDPEECTAEIVSLFMKSAYRREGYATDLIISVCTILSQDQVPYRIICDVTEFFDGGAYAGSDLRGLFKYLEFTEEELPETGCYSCRAADLKDSRVLGVKSKLKLKHISELTKLEKNSFAEEDNPYLIDDLNKGRLDGDLSLFYTENSQIKGCLCIKSDEESSTIVWARVDSACKTALIPMLGEAFSTLIEKRGEDIRLIIPYINQTSKTLIEKVLGEKLQIAEKNYRYTYSLADSELTGTEEDEWDRV